MRAVRVTSAVSVLALLATGCRSGAGARTAEMGSFHEVGVGASVDPTVKPARLLPESVDETSSFGFFPIFLSLTNSLCSCFVHIRPLKSIWVSHITRTGPWRAELDRVRVAADQHIAARRPSSARPVSRPSGTGYRPNAQRRCVGRSSRPAPTPMPGWRRQAGRPGRP